jgi:hypothetical protein
MRTRSVVAIVLGATLLLVLGGVLVVMKGGDARHVGAFNNRAYSSGKTALYAGAAGSEQFLGYLKSYTGCEPRGTVAQTPTKHISGVAIVPCEIEFALTSMDPSLYSWVTAAISGSAAPKSLWIVETDYSYNVDDVIHLTGAEISRVAFPELDANLKTTAYVRTQLRAASSSHPYPCCGGFSHTKAQGAVGPSSSSKVFGFKAEIGTLPSSRINHVDPVVVTVDPSGTVNVDDLELTLSRIDTGPWAQWFDSFVIQGVNATAQEKCGRLTFLSVSQQELASIRLTGLGIFSRGSGDDGAGTVARDAYGFYVKGATFASGSSGATICAGASPPPPPPPTTQTTTATTTTAATTTAAQPPAPQPEPPPPPKEEVKLLAPERLDAKPIGEAQVQLSWNRVENAEGYAILISTSPKEGFQELARPEKLENPEEPSYVVSRLKSGVTYYFVVRALAGESQSEDSPIAEVVAE